MTDEFADDIAAIGEIEAVSSILDVICLTTGMGFAAVARVTEDRWIACRVRDDIGFGLKPGGELPIATTICDEIRESGQGVVIDHVAEHADWRTHHTPATYGFQSYLSLPMVRADGSFFGTLCAIDPKPRAISAPETVEMVRLFAELIANQLDARDRNATLERRVAERTAELGRAQDALRQAQKMEAVGQLTGGVAHDFNNLLTVVRASAELLRRPELAPERRERYLDAIIDTVDRATALTAQLLAFARRQTLQPQVFDAGRAVVADRAMLETLAGSRVTISIRRPDEPCWINADPNQLDTAIFNMVVNARDATDGAGRIAIDVRGVSCLPEWRGMPLTEGPHIAITVRDTGPGVPDDLIDQIFEPFFTTKDVGRGTGLGLSQVFGFAKQSGGEVHVDSVIGDGAAFTLYLPSVAAPDRGEDAPVEPTRVAVRFDARVLVVEDNAEIGGFAASALTDMGYRTISANGAEEALAILRAGHDGIDVVFSDVMMPGMNGIDLARTIRSEIPDLPIVLTSGYSDAAARGGTGGFELLQKPYSIERLARVLQDACGVRQS